MSTAADSRFNVGVSSRFTLLPDEDDACDPEETLQKLVQMKAPVAKPKKEVNALDSASKGNKVDNKLKAAPVSKVVPVKPAGTVQTIKPAIATLKDTKTAAKPKVVSKPAQNPVQEPAPPVVRNVAPRFNKPTENAVPAERFAEEDAGQLKENHFKQPRHFEKRPPVDMRQRQFDRHSGSDKTGIKSIEKKDGAGAHNWGTFADDLKAEAAIQQHDPTEYSGLPPSSTATVVTGAETEGPKAEVPVEIPAAKLMTLQEYKAQQSKELANRMSKLSSNGKQDKVRVANDGADFGDMVAYKKVHEERNEEETVEGPAKHIVPIDIRFNDSDSRGRGSMGAGGGYIGRGGAKAHPGGNSEVGVNSPATPLVLNDETDFPKLH